MILEFMNRLVNILIAPDLAINSIKHVTNKSAIILPIILLSIAYGLSFHLTKDIVFEEQIRKIEHSERYNDDQIIIIKSKLEKQKTSIIPYLSACIAPIILIFIIAGIFYFTGNFFGGGESTYLQILLAAVYIQSIDLASILLKTPLVIAQGSSKVYTSLVLILPDLSEGSWLFNSLAQIDLFRIWKMILWVIAFKILYGYSKTKSMTLSISVFALWMIVSAVIMNLTL